MEIIPSFSDSESRQQADFEMLVGDVTNGERSVVLQELRIIRSILSIGAGLICPEAYESNCMKIEYYPNIIIL